MKQSNHQRRTAPQIKGGTDDQKTDRPSARAASGRDGPFGLHEDLHQREHQGHSEHAGYSEHTKVEIKWVASETCLDDKKTQETLSDVDMVVVPGVDGAKGIEGKLNIIKYSRENNIPFLGISLGFQCAVVEFARNVAGLKDANSPEFAASTPHPVISLMEDEKSTAGYSSAFRLGAGHTKLKPGTKTRAIYGEKEIPERHRHRYELNNEFREVLEGKGLVISGTTPDGLLADTLELSDKDWFVACQYHPEFKSRPERPHPLFLGLMKSALKQQKDK